MKKIAAFKVRVRRQASKLEIPKRCLPDFEIYGPLFTELNRLKPSEFRYQGRVLTV